MLYFIHIISAPLTPRIKEKVNIMSNITQQQPSTNQNTCLICGASVLHDDATPYHGQWVCHRCTCAAIQRTYSLHTEGY